MLRTFEAKRRKMAKLKPSGSVTVVATHPVLSELVSDLRLSSRRVSPVSPNRPGAACRKVRTGTVPHYAEQQGDWKAGKPDANARRMQCESGD